MSVANRYVSSEGDLFVEMPDGGLWLLYDKACYEEMLSRVFGYSTDREFNAAADAAGPSPEVQP